MFTGIVEACAPVLELVRAGAGARLVVQDPADDWRVAPGDSVAVSGCCLTVAERPSTASKARAMAFDLSAETLERTWLGSLAPRRRVNLERALRMGDRLGGHLVSGHVDGLGRVTSSTERGDGGRELECEVADGFERYLVEKGSVTVDGVSLTVVAPRGRSFRVALIPETLARTTLGTARIGDALHLEADMVGKWIERLLEARRA
jgi:riboflavin synthase